MRSLLRRSDGFDHSIRRSGGRQRRDDPLRLTGVPRNPPRWIVGASTVSALPDLPVGSLEFVTDRLGALHLHEEEAALADTKEPSAPTKPRDLRRRRSVRWRIKKCRPSQPTRAVLRRIALMMASNLAVVDVNLVLFSLANVSRQLTGGPPLPTPRSFSE